VSEFKGSTAICGVSIWVVMFAVVTIELIKL